MQRKKKRSIIFELHSIPIKIRSLCANTRKNIMSLKSLRISNKRLYLVSYSIPLSCMVVLLLVGMVSIFPSLNRQVNAIGDDGAATQGDGSSTSSVVSLTVGGDAVDKTVEVGINEVAYRKHSVSVRVADMMDYYLVLAGDPNLTLQSSTSTNTVPTVSNNVVGAEMPENRWGFAWEKDGSTSESELTYRPVSNSSITLESDSALSAGSVVDFDGQLNFAAKFGDSTVLGKYSSKVSLSLIATPKTVSTAAQWKNLNGDPIGAGVESGTMQGAGPDFCANDAVRTGFTIGLKDARDGNTYTIVKLKDGKCWMQQNLRLTATSEEGLALTSNDTDIEGSWTLPKTLVGTETTVAGWIDDNTVAQSATFNDATYGTYYSWCAATAETCSSAATSGAVASGSICPKGWHLPSGNTDGEFYTLMNGLNMSAVVASPYFFSTAGYIDSGSLVAAGSGGFYWSRTPSSTGAAYRLYLYSNNLHPGTNSIGRHYGFSVRCIHDGAGEWETTDNNIIPTDLQYMQDITKQNFTDKYCSRDADSLIPVGSILRLVDSRDYKTYGIVKLEDGNCWMQENLALGSMTNGITLTSENSDVSKNYVLPANTSKWNVGTTAQSVRVGDINMVGWKLSYGNYYSWQVATANTAPSGAGTATSSICPKGWKLPTGGGYDDISQFNSLFGVTSDFYDIYDTAQDKSIAIQSAPYEFSAAGEIDTDGSFRGAGSYGSYWSRISNASSAYILTLSPNGFSPGANYSSRIYGYSVRCVAEPVD